MAIPQIGFQELIERYEVILFDAFGVLVNCDGVLPGAIEAIETLRRRGQEYFLVTNGARFTCEITAERLQKKRSTV